MSRENETDEHDDLDLLARVLSGLATEGDRERAAALLARDPEWAEAFRIAQEIDE